jgi:uncharacterized protein (DUF885 family)
VNDHLVPVRFIAEKIPGQAEGAIASNPFILPLKRFPASFSDAEKNRFTEQITSTVNNEVFPAYKQFAAYDGAALLRWRAASEKFTICGSGSRRCSRS